MKPILVDREVKKFLDKKKIIKRESYNSVLRRLLKLKGGKKWVMDKVMDLFLE